MHAERQMVFLAQNLKVIESENESVDKQAYMACLPILAKEGCSVLKCYLPLVTLLPLIILSTFMVV